MRRRTRIFALSAFTILAAVLAGVAVAPRVGNAIAGADGIHDAAALPRQIRVCNRSWQKDSLDRHVSLAETRELFGGGVVVDPAASDACPPGPCTDVARPGACDVVVWVRVGGDAYLDYALQGGS
jgi:hypothetical protein